MKVIDNFLSESEFDGIKTNMTSNAFPWYLTSVIDYDSDTDTHLGYGSLDKNSLCDPENNKQFSYLFYAFDDGNGLGRHVRGDRFELILPLVKALKMNRPIHIKSNLTVRTPKILEHGYHTDHPYYPAKTAVYYLNTNDGYTMFETGKKVESVANRIVIFDSNIKHTGTTCTDKFGRFVINMNWRD